MLLGITLVAAGLGAMGSVSAASFYASLVLPDWAPPATVFGPVWSVLYLLMAWAAWWVWRHRQRPGATAALLLYAAALVPNALWSWLFFDQRLGAWALLDVVVLWLLVAFTVRGFWNVRPVAGALMVPLCLWVSFAAVLNAVVWRANPGLLG